MNPLDRSTSDNESAAQPTSAAAIPAQRLRALRGKIRILIADDHAIVRAGLRQFIEDQHDMEVAAEATSGSQAVALVRAQTFDVVLLDISMPDKNGIDTLKTLKRIRPDLPVLMLSVYAEDRYAVNLLRGGASGYVNKEAAAAQLIEAIRTVVDGRKFVSPALAEILVSGVAGESERQPHEALTQREFQIFCKLAAGMAASRIAQDLNLSVKTIGTYRMRVLQKMEMQSNADLTYYAIKKGLIA